LKTDRGYFFLSFILSFFLSFLGGEYPTESLDSVGGEHPIHSFILGPDVVISNSSSNLINCNHVYMYVCTYVHHHVRMRL